jgi:hypothetical protein
LSGTTNTLSWTVVSGGTNIKWLNWSTNGSNDIIIKGGFTYQVDTFVDRQTNITAKVWSDDPFVPFRGLLIQGGNSISNAWAGGTVFVDTTSYTNLNAASQFTNMGSITIPAHMLTNSGDALRAEWSGNILAGTNRFMIGYGSITNMFDSGSMTNKALNNYIIRASITRNGNTSERVYGEMSWNGGNGLPFTYTNFNKTILETNGIDNLLALKAFSNRLGGITNNYFRVFYEAVPR